MVFAFLDRSTKQKGLLVWGISIARCRWCAPARASVCHLCLNCSEDLYTTEVNKCYPEITEGVEVCSLSGEGWVHYRCSHYVRMAEVRTCTLDSRQNPPHGSSYFDYGNIALIVLLCAEPLLRVPHLSSTFSPSRQSYLSQFQMTWADGVLRCAFQNNLKTPRGQGRVQTWMEL